ncbi:hypothetical protein KI387_003977, partial [Taxus chinensis]
DLVPWDGDDDMGMGVGCSNCHTTMSAAWVVVEGGVEEVDEMDVKVEVAPGGSGMGESTEVVGLCAELDHMRVERDQMH